MSITATIDIEKLIGKLPIEKKIQLVQRLEKTTWARRLDNVVNNIRGQIKSIPSEEKINKICEMSRKKVYARYKSSH